MAESIRIVVEESTQTSQARRTARELAEGLGFDSIRAEQVAIVATEACSNVIKHAGGGVLLLRSTAGDNGDLTIDLEILALDRGPGMANVRACREDGFTTADSAGQGLGAIERLATSSDIYSVPGLGTGLLARWRSPERRTEPLHPRAAIQPLQVGAVNVPKPGEVVCGDSWGVFQNEEFSLILVADGLGHGYEASLAAKEAVRTMQRHTSLRPNDLLGMVHRALRSSRGAAVAITRIDRLAGRLEFAGVGNICAQIYDGPVPGQHLVSINGTAGHDNPRLRSFVYNWPANGILMVHSDGLSTSTGLQSKPSLFHHDSSLIAGILYRDFVRGNDDATVVIAKAAQELT